MNQHNFHIILTSFFYLPIICELIGVGAEQTILCPYQGQTFFLKKSAQISGSQQGEVLAPVCSRRHLTMSGDIFGFTAGEEGRALGSQKADMLLNILYIHNNLPHKEVSCPQHQQFQGRETLTWRDAVLLGYLGSPFPYTSKQYSHILNGCSSAV